MPSEWSEEQVGWARGCGVGFAGLIEAAGAWAWLPAAVGAAGTERPRPRYRYDAGHDALVQPKPNAQCPAYAAVVHRVNPASTAAIVARATSAVQERNGVR